MELYLDLEWTQIWKNNEYKRQNIILAGFYIPNVLKKQLYDSTYSKKEFQKILNKLNPENDLILFHGPDIGYLEKEFDMNIRDHFYCINMQKVLKTYTRRKKIGLKHLEKEFKIKRNYPVLEHHEIRRFWGYGGKKKSLVLGYNMEDIVNLYHLKKAICKQYKVTNEMLKNIRLTHNSSSKKNMKKIKKR